MSSVIIDTGNYTNQARTAFLNILKGGSGNTGYDIAFIDVGTGGEYTPAGVFTGNRVAPDPAETEIRKRLFRANIVYSSLDGDNKIRFVAGLEPHECLSNVIDEFALISSNGVMIAHYVTSETGPTPSPTTKYTKSSVVAWALTWVININLTI